MIIGSVSEVFAVRTLVLYRNRTGCFLGCNRTNVKREAGTILLANGTWENVIFSKISCSGTGMLHCPNKIALIEDGTTITAFQQANVNLMLTHAVTSIGSGVTTGSHTITVLNTNTNLTWKYDVEWSVSASGEEIISVYKENI